MTFVKRGEPSKYSSTHGLNRLMPPKPLNSEVAVKSRLQGKSSQPRSATAKGSHFSSICIKLRSIRVEPRRADRQSGPGYHPLRRQIYKNRGAQDRVIRG